MEAHGDIGRDLAEKLGAWNSYAHAHAHSITMKLKRLVEPLPYTIASYTHPLRCKLGPFVTWYLMKYYCHTRLGSSNFACEILLRILLARLIWSAHMDGDAEWNSGSTLAGFPTFCPMTFHLLASYSLIAANKAAL